MNFETLSCFYSTQTIQHLSAEGSAIGLRTDLETGAEEILRWSPGAGAPEVYPSTTEVYRAGDLLRALHTEAVRLAREARA